MAAPRGLRSDQTGEQLRETVPGDDRSSRGLRYDPPLERKRSRTGSGRDLAGIGDVAFHKTHIQGCTRALMEKSGLAQAVAKAGGELCCFEEPGWDAFYPETPLHGTNWREPLMVSGTLQDVDHIVLLPRCAHHFMAGASLGLKAAIGYCRTDTRLMLHKEAASFSEKIAEANTILTLVKKQRLVLTVADKVLTMYGPNEGCVIQTEPGLVIASSSVVAHDMVSLAWLLKNRGQTPLSELHVLQERSKRFADVSNRHTVRMLSGSRLTAYKSERLATEEPASVWDDRVLRHAFTVFHGIPHVILHSLEQLPETIEQDLQAAVARQA